MNGFIEKALKARRSMEDALTDMLADYERNPRPELARTIALLRDEIEFRKGRSDYSRFWDGLREIAARETDDHLR